MNNTKNYYVYCLIDPRTGKPFYYGKGIGNRKFAHGSQGKSKKPKRIRQIEAAGKESIIRVIAAGLTKDQALLIEAT
ncbi:MAG TPA: GIY-YIG nuclease family protein, partial [Verrucomicrobiae bacterium]